MKIYLDDDSASALLVRLLQREGHDVVVPADVGNVGIKDPAHFLYAILNQRVLLTANYKDFDLLHELVVGAAGHHPGILAVRKDNDPSSDLKPPTIVRAVRNLVAAGVPIEDELHILNHWR